MTALVSPDVRWCKSWVATVAELRTEGEHIQASGWWVLGEPLEPTEEACRRWVPVLEKAQYGDAEKGRVASDYFWVTAGDGGPDDEMIGFLNLRHELNDWLLEEGGHIGYAIRPARRRQGHATRALALAVRRASDLGIDRVLVTCDLDNEASRRTIEACGGVFDDIRNGKRRYWITPVV